MQEQEQKQLKNSNRWLIVWFILAAVALAIGFTVTYFAPPPFKAWGAATTITVTASLLMLRALTDFMEVRKAESLMPYVVPTFAALSLIMFFAPVDAARIATYALLGILGVVFFYWMIHLVVKQFRKQ